MGTPYPPPATFPEVPSITRTTVLVDWILPIILLAGATVPFWTTDLDLSVAARFYTPGAGWEHGGEQPWKALKDYGVIPAWAVGVAALTVVVGSRWRRGWRRLRRGALFLVLALALGPGVVVNDVFKENWGRPRPLDVTGLGGERAYVKPWVKSPREMGGSFASGHAAMGFYLLVPYFLVRRRSRKRAAWIVLLGLAYGSLVGYARMVQGAHFLSDVLWALGFVYLTALILYYALSLHRVPGGARDARADSAPPA